MKASTGDADIDEMIGLSVVDTTKLGVGTYKLLGLIDFDANYDVDLSQINDTELVVKPREATLVQTAIRTLTDNGVSANEIRMIETGESVSLKTLDDLCRILHCVPLDIIG